MLRRLRALAKSVRRLINCSVEHPANDELSLHTCTLTGADGLTSVFLASPDIPPTRASEKVNPRNGDGGISGLFLFEEKEMQPNLDRKISWIIKQDLDSKEKMMLVLLVHLSGDNERCQASIAELGKFSSMSPDSVRRSIKELERKAFIEVERCSSGRQNLTNRYVVKRCGKGKA